MRKLFSLLMISGALFLMPGCGDDDGPGSNNCTDAANNINTALQTFLDNPTSADACQDYVDAITDALNACNALGQAQLDAWNDVLDSDPCGGL